MGTGNIKKIKVTTLHWSMMNNIKANKSRLPKSFPKTSIDTQSRFMEEIDIVTLELHLHSGWIRECTLHDLHCLNHWLISKYGNKLWSKDRVQMAGQHSQEENDDHE